MQPLRVGMIGLGVVGSGVAELLQEQRERLTRRAGRPVELVRVAVRDPDKPRAFALDRALLTDDPQAVMGAPDVDVIVELVGGTTHAREFIVAALEAGKDVVTANKALLCEQGPELFALARERGRSISFEAAVAGGVPIIKVLVEALSANQIQCLHAIINGTSNFILTEMLERGAGYPQAVQMAQELGFAEADPTMDVDGTDAAQKLSLLTWLAFRTRVLPGQFPVQGIDTVELADLQCARELGYTIKLLATARLVDGQLEMHTQPTFVRNGQQLAQVGGALNMISLTGDALGESSYAGPGAGRMPTASAAVADLVDVAAGRALATFNRLDVCTADGGLRLQPQEQIVRRYYLRFHVEDRPHVIADITDVLGRNEISLASVMQHEAPEPATAEQSPIVPLVIMTHRTTEGQVRRALCGIEQLDCLRPPPVCIPVSD